MKLAIIIAVLVIAVVMAGGFLLLALQQDIWTTERLTKCQRKRRKKKIELVMQTLSPQVFEYVEEYQISIPMLSAIIGEAYGMLRMIELDSERTGDSNDMYA